MSDSNYEVVRKVLETVTSANWDRHYGQGISAEYARSVHSEAASALAALEEMQLALVYCHGILPAEGEASGVLGPAAFKPRWFAIQRVVTKVLKGGDAPRPHDQTRATSEGCSDAPAATEQSTAGASAEPDWENLIGRARRGDFSVLDELLPPKVTSTAGASANEEISEQDYEDGDPSLRHTWNTPPECAARKALEEIKAMSEAPKFRSDKPTWARMAEVATEALATPCPCTEPNDIFRYTCGHLRNGRVDPPGPCKICVEINGLKEENDSLRNRLGDSQCWNSGDPMPPKDEALKSCERFIDQQHAEHGVFQGGKTIAQLEAENERLKDTIELLAAREKAEARVKSRLEHWMAKAAYEDIPCQSDLRRNPSDSIKWQSAQPAEQMKRAEKAEAALAEIRRIPVMPFPDPVAHSHRAFGDAVFRAYSDIQRIAAAFVATHKSEGK